MTIPSSMTFGVERVLSGRWSVFRIVFPNVIKALIVTGGNPVVSLPDSNAFREALKKLDLLVVHDLFMTETAELAHYVLPACTHLEKNGLAYSYNVCHGLPYLDVEKKSH